MINLTKMQQEALPILKWLYRPGFAEATGRTEVLAHAFIQLAIEHPNTPIFLQDHFHYPHCQKDLMSRVCRLIEEYPGDFKLKVSYSEKSIVCKM